ncbi:MAG: phosphoribosylformylglycinamidine synthase subunit PurQ [Sphingomonadales bacterium]|jgi:phosphoribosylformylglycinamidine synthase
MKAAVIVFPGSNCDRDVKVALEKITGVTPEMIWHGDSTLPKTDLIVLPGGFSFGDYLRSGAIAARSPIMKEVVKQANDGTPTLGICNGFQILTDAGLLPGVLMRNAGLHFLCKDVTLTVENSQTAFTNAFNAGAEITIPIAHHDGNYFADEAVLKELEDNRQIAFRYQGNPNGSAHDIAGITNKSGSILGMMPHPERLIDEDLGGTDGRLVFESLVSALN